jgi:hypothetical protein
MEEVEIQQYIVALEELSPMPSDEALENDPERIDRYADILHDLKKPRETEGRLDCRIVEALINSFGPGDGFEVYWSTVHLIEAAQCVETYHLIELSLASGAPGVRKWCCFLLGRKRDPANLGLLIERLHDSDVVVVHEALGAIRKIGCDHPVSEAAPFVAGLTTHPNAEIVSAAQETLVVISEQMS